jgi:hypothetical protein
VQRIGEPETSERLLEPADQMKRRDVMLILQRTQRTLIREYAALGRPEDGKIRMARGVGPRRPCPPG